jgi:hypothetical protein
VTSLSIIPSPIESLPVATFISGRTIDGILGVAVRLEWLGLRNKQGKLMLLGLDDAGKTTLLQCLKTGNFVQFETTKSYHIEDLTIEGENAIGRTLDR